MESPDDVFFVASVHAPPRYEPADLGSLKAASRHARAILSYAASSQGLRALNYWPMGL